MQTLETTRRLSELDRELIAKAVETISACRTAGDIDGMLALFAPDIVCFPTTTWRHARYPRRIVGREAVREAFRHRHINYVSENVTAHRMLIDANQAVVHRTTTLRERGSRITYTYDSVEFYKFCDGLLIEYCEYPDGSALKAVINFPL